MGGKMVKELERRQKLKRWVYSWPSLGLLALITFFLVKGAVGLLKIERESAGRVSELEGEASTLTLRESELEAQVGRLKTPEGIVEEIKDKFSAVREGEYVAIIVDERKKATIEESAERSWLGNIWQGFKNLFEDRE